MKTATEILYENGIDLMSLNDEFNTSLLKAMEEHAQSAKAEAWDKLLEEVKDILDIPLEEQEKLSNLSNPYKS